MVEIGHAYAFIGGAVVGRFAGILSSIVVGGVLLYVADSSVFTVENLTHTKEIVVGFVQNFVK